MKFISFRNETHFGIFCQLHDVFSSFKPELDFFGGCCPTSLRCYQVLQLFMWWKNLDIYVLLALLLLLFFLYYPANFKWQFQDIINNNKRIPIKARCHFQSYLVGHLENKGWHASSLLQIWHENNSDASLKREKGLNSRHRKIFGYVTKEYLMH